MTNRPSTNGQDEVKRVVGKGVVRQIDGDRSRLRSAQTEISEAGEADPEEVRSSPLARRMASDEVSRVHRLTSVGGVGVSTDSNDRGPSQNQ